MGEKRRLSLRGITPVLREIIVLTAKCTVTLDHVQTQTMEQNSTHWGWSILGTFIDLWLVFKPFSMNFPPPLMNELALYLFSCIIVADKIVFGNKINILLLCSSSVWATRPWAEACTETKEGLVKVRGCQNCTLEDRVSTLKAEVGTLQEKDKKVCSRCLGSVRDQACQQSLVQGGLFSC